MALKSKAKSKLGVDYSQDAIMARALEAYETSRKKNNEDPADGEEGQEAASDMLLGSLKGSKEDYDSSSTPEQQLSAAFGNTYDIDIEGRSMGSVINEHFARGLQQLKGVANTYATSPPARQAARGLDLGEATKTSKQYAQEAGTLARDRALAEFDQRRTLAARASEYLSRNSGEVIHKDTAVGSGAGLNLNTSDAFTEKLNAAMRIRGGAPSVKSKG